MHYTDPISFKQHIMLFVGIKTLEILFNIDWVDNLIGVAIYQLIIHCHIP